MYGCCGDVPFLGESFIRSYRIMGSIFRNFAKSWVSFQTFTERWVLEKNLQKYRYYIKGNVSYFAELGPRLSLNLRNYDPIVLEFS